jgi:hypothetical protein
MKKLKRLLVLGLFKIVFGLGEVADWLAMNKYVGRWEWPYSVYSWLMGKSLQLDDKYSLGQWTKPDEKDTASFLVNWIARDN